jgi:hypothetical protein
VFTSKFLVVVFPDAGFFFNSFLNRRRRRRELHSSLFNNSYLQQRRHVRHIQSALLSVQEKVHGATNQEEAPPPAGDEAHDASEDLEQVNDFPSFYNWKSRCMLDA